MIVELRIENFAIIQRLELNLSSGLMAFTGETGAGKSIILDAIEALVGGRADAGMIRSGFERAVVEATFRMPEASRAAMLQILEREELLDDEHEVTLARELRREGRNIARVNGRTVSLGLLRELGAFLVDIHGQSEHLSLYNVREHLLLLDRYAVSEPQLAAYRQVYTRLNALRRDLAALRQTEADAERRTDMLNYQVQEIEAAQLKPGEEETLRQERERLANAENLASLAQQALQMLDEGTPEAPSISDLAGQLVQALNAIAKIDSSQAALAEQAGGLVDTLEDVAGELRDYLDGMEFNPRRLEQVEDRLDMISKLKRKFGGSIEAALAFAEDARAQLDTILHAEERITELEAEESTLLAEMARLGLALSAHRKAAAQTLAQSVETELDDLRMEGAHFAVDMHFQPDPDGVPLDDGQVVAFDSTGFDRVEFLVAPNPGEGLKPMVKIASGGETSRLMLALKNTLVRADPVPTLIFDEIDQGIGGRVGSVVGEKLWRLGRQHQVLCVTHLPQLAAFGDLHFRVGKHVEDGRTMTSVEKLDDGARLEELAQMLGNLTDVNLNAARETLDSARQRATALHQHA
ncbi:MAG TPA: DNA repair protein RecN [Anaerolineaceae bacterium]